MPARLPTIRRPTHGDVARTLAEQSTGTQGTNTTSAQIPKSTNPQDINTTGAQGTKSTQPANVRRTYHLPPPLAEWVREEAYRRGSAQQRVTESSVVAEAIQRLMDDD